MKKTSFRNASAELLLIPGTVPAAEPASMQGETEDGAVVMQSTYHPGAPERSHDVPSPRERRKRQFSGPDDAGTV